MADQRIIDWHAKQLEKLTKEQLQAILDQQIPLTLKAGDRSRIDQFKLAVAKALQSKG